LLQRTKYDTHDNTSNIVSKQITELLKNEITKTEFNFIKDKMFYSLGVAPTDLITNFQKLKDIIIELFGDERANQLITKLNAQLKL